ncbi:hypothetical protein [Streptomyces sp. RKAG290]|uniref:hypothetical protein n=1 Tax=Streptomyces sp. RKAG290 TaxID=2888348 RepID=UPI0020346831|nr:hypothetical protein [Streptomyces sp. RKAG290]MCM2416443.1 hypothetical protein [Streptomyces sp. RKAG290]
MWDNADSRGAVTFYLKGDEARVRVNNADASASEERTYDTGIKLQPTGDDEAADA